LGNEPVEIKGQRGMIEGKALPAVGTDPLHEIRRGSQEHMEIPLVVVPADAISAIKPKATSMRKPAAA